jgi:hypothetical protein
MDGWQQIAEQANSDVWRPNVGFDTVRGGTGELTAVEASAERRLYGGRHGPSPALWLAMLARWLDAGTSLHAYSLVLNPPQAANVGRGGQVEVCGLCHDPITGGHGDPIRRIDQVAYHAQKGGLNCYWKVWRTAQQPSATPKPAASVPVAGGHGGSPERPVAS